MSTVLKKLPERYQEVILLYYYHEMTMKEIGGLLGINESRVSQIHKAAKERMARELTAIGVTSGECMFFDEHGKSKSHPLGPKYLQQ